MPAAAARPRAAARGGGGALPQLRRLASRLLDPRDRGAALAVSVALCLAEALLCALIIRRVPYTEIDWEAYMQEVASYQAGERDYTKLRGDTGPLVYPAGFVYVYAALRNATGGAVAAAQPLFALLYVATLATALGVTVAAGVVPPLALPLLCASKRLHSIYVLRLFNEAVAMLPALAAVALLQRAAWLPAALAWSAALSVKMNALLLAPPMALLMLRAARTRDIFASAFAALALQLALGAPFLASHPREYVSRAFDFGRRFEQRWSVNLQFLPETVFLSRATATALLAAHLALLLAFAHARWLRDAGGLPQLLRASLGRLRGMRPPLAALSGEYVAAVMLEGNLIGVACARSLHFQFYAWYALSLPLLAWRSALPLPAKLALLAALEACWNVYPPTARTSAALNACHLVLLAALAARPLPPQRSARAAPPPRKAAAKRR